MAAKMVELIEATERRGNGTDADPVRMVTGWWTKAGDLVVEDDKWLAESNEKRLKNLDGVAALLKCEQFQCISALNHELGKEQEEVALSTRVLAAAIGCRKWLEHEAKQRAATAKRKKDKLPPLEDLGVMTRTKVRQKLERLHAERQRRNGGKR